MVPYQLDTDALRYVWKGVNVIAASMHQHVEEGVASDAYFAAWLTYEFEPYVLKDDRPPADSSGGKGTPHKP